MIIAAAATEPHNPAAADSAGNDPEGWWAAHGDGQPLGYSNLLAQLAGTPGARRGLLTDFFEPSDENLAAGEKVPGPAHRAIAALARAGYIKVIITTNFDRLIERACEEAGVLPQVVSRADAVAGMIPLAHAKVTVIKIHGDYADLALRNTIDELDEYPPAWETLLAQVFSEYGLVVSGWSAEWDHALARAIEATPSRRYPLFWDARSSKKEAAQRLLIQRQGLVVSAHSADSFFTGLIDRVEAIARLSEAPLTTAVAVSRVKRYMADPVRRIELDDLLTATTDRATDAAARLPISAGSPITYADALHTLRADSDTILRVLAEGVWYDHDRTFTDLWTRTITRLLRTRPMPIGSWNEYLERVRHYPALLACRTVGVTAVHAGRDDVLLRALTEARFRPRAFAYGQTSRELPAYEAIIEYDILDSASVVTARRWNGDLIDHPLSHLQREDLRDVFTARLPDDEDYRWESNRYEYRVALLQWNSSSAERKDYMWNPGEFLGNRRLGRIQVVLDQPTPTSAPDCAMTGRRRLGQRP